VHVAHVIVDGLIKTDQVQGFVGAEAFKSKVAKDEMLVPDEIASNYVNLAKQHRSAWTFELDLRPYTEKI
jgi:hypothetical protein